jgi:ATP-dependent protease ClpP protease subunit
MIWKATTIGTLAMGMAMTLAAVLWAVQALVNRFTPPHST